jgi:hypothetical protein
MEGSGMGSGARASVPGSREPLSAPMPAPLNADAGDGLDARIDAMVSARLSASEAKHAAAIKVLSDQLKAAQRGTPITSVPFNAGGVGEEIAETWSQYHQELANRGELTEDQLHLVRGEPRKEVA